ncbi:hypothetical protein [Allochromatium palmeri]|uniref:oxidoreductase n=1 Tax=Allochromatium palmeri TaxID=231048 RepID=UPI001CA3AE50
MPTPKLFEPLTIGSLRLANRIVIAPMCQYSATNGCMSDWHLIHLGQLALSGAALLTMVDKPSPPPPCPSVPATGRRSRSIARR